MTVHSTNHNGGNGQHPSHSTFTANADFTEDPIIAGFEWNIRHEIGQVSEGKTSDHYPPTMTRLTSRGG